MVGPSRLILGIATATGILLAVAGCSPAPAGFAPGGTAPATPPATVDRRDSAPPQAATPGTPVIAPTVAVTSVVQATSPVLATPADHGTRDVSSESSTEIEADDFYFAPSRLQGRPGQTLTIAIENASAVQHNFSVAGQAVDLDVTPGGRATIQATFPTAGVLNYFCKYHGDRGMGGRLVVDGS